MPYTNTDSYLIQRRDLAIYFFRISFIFLVFWTPTVLTVYIIPVTNYWVRYAIGNFGHLQGVASASVSLMKSDVKEAFVNFITCKWRRANAEYVEEQSLLKSGVKKSEIKAMKSKAKLMSFKNYPYDLPRQRVDYKFEDEIYNKTSVASSLMSASPDLDTSDVFKENEVYPNPAPVETNQEETSSALIAMEESTENEE